MQSLQRQWLESVLAAGAVSDLVCKSYCWWHLLPRKAMWKWPFYALEITFEIWDSPGSKSLTTLHEFPCQELPVAYNKGFSFCSFTVFSSREVWLREGGCLNVWVLGWWDLSEFPPGSCMQCGRTLRQQCSGKVGHVFTWIADTISSLCSLCFINIAT